MSPAEADLRDVLLRNGFVPCDIAACNCGSWHARYGLPERMDEIKQALADAGHPLSNENGNLTLNALTQLVVERDALRARCEAAETVLRESREFWCSYSMMNECAQDDICDEKDAMLKRMDIDAAMSQDKRKDALDRMARDADELGLDF